jgi:hypothetical protein
VEKVDPALVTRDAKGEVETVRYDAVNAMLLNEFLKQHRKVEEQEHKANLQDRKVKEQEATIAKQQKDFQATVARLTARLDEQAAQMQKVSAQVEMSRPPRRGRSSTISKSADLTNSSNCSLASTKN